MEKDWNVTRNIGGIMITNNDLHLIQSYASLRSLPHPVVDTLFLYYVYLVLMSVLFPFVLSIYR